MWSRGVRIRVRSKGKSRVRIKNGTRSGSRMELGYSGNRLKRGGKGRVG